jgi:FkbH-like protein
VKFAEALETARRAPEGTDPFGVVLACGFTPLHVQTFLAAYLQQALPDRRVTVSPGLYGDTTGTLESLPYRANAVAVVLEWQDLDSRLGYRSLGKWGVSALSDMLKVAEAMLQRLCVAIEKIPPGVRVAVCLPTLPLPPMFHAPGWQTTNAELSLRQLILHFAAQVAQQKGCAVVSDGWLHEESPAQKRFDFKSDLLVDLPYTLQHADVVACCLARLLMPPSPKKGLITDLDDTMWHGIVGEVGPDAVSWDLSCRHQIHGLYQKLLRALAEEGVLIAVASKNDPAVVESVFRRSDLLLPADRVFPIEVNWGAKSASVERVLQFWNIAAESVVFVDDSAMELAEVGGAHPGIECIQFPKNDYEANLAMLRRLRDLFGKSRLSDEDALRLDSIRRNSELRAAAQAPATHETFLRDADAVLTFDFDRVCRDPRALELINKTNQFNLNGVRYTDADWQERLACPGAVAATVGYKDKFGFLGKIAVVQGCHEGDVLRIDTWVMSCRAFSRRIEHQCVRILLDRTGAREIRFAFRRTEKNRPIREFFAAFTGYLPEGPLTLTRSEFEANCPPLYHHVSETLPTRPM